MATTHRYTHAVVCRIPNSLKANGNGIPKDVSLELARRQHEELVRVLREVIGLDVIELAADEHQPTSVFVEDVAIVCNGAALIARPANPARKTEVDTMRAILKKELGMPIIEIRDQTATLEGGDVLFTGKEFFVGLTKWTNEAGAKAVANAFPEYPVTSIPIKPGNVHLKNIMSMAGPNIICVGSSRESQEVLKRIEREATFQYHTLTVPDDQAANCIYANGTLIHRADLVKSLEKFREKVDYSHVALEWSHLSHPHAVTHLLQGTLSACVLLVRKSKNLNHRF